MVNIIISSSDYSAAVMRYEDKNWSWSIDRFGIGACIQTNYLHSLIDNTVHNFALTI